MDAVLSSLGEEFYEAVDAASVGGEAREASDEVSPSAASSEGEAAFNDDYVFLEGSVSLEKMTAAGLA